jgi:hypothetical protein
LQMVITGHRIYNYRVDFFAGHRPALDESCRPAPSREVLRDAATD